MKLRLPRRRTVKQEELGCFEAIKAAAETIPAFQLPWLNAILSELEEK